MNSSQLSRYSPDFRSIHHLNKLRVELLIGPIKPPRKARKG